MPVDSRPLEDHYAVLQVHPRADQDVIDAAYRQLMKKYHPDLASGDPHREALHNERSKIINKAYSVLRDPTQRELYDAALIFGNPIGGAHPSQPSRPTETHRPRSSVPENGRQSQSRVAWSAEHGSDLVPGAEPGGPLGILGAAYYLLPGPYEWENGRREELIAVCLVPPLTTAAFALATGRLTPWLGGSLNGTLLAWGCLLLLAAPIWRSLPRVAIAAVPSMLLLSGVIDPILRQAAMPAWLAWLFLGVLSLVFSARVYVFGLLPALCVCWLLVRLT